MTAQQSGKLAVVTGIAGLGLEIARALAAAGADVILAGRDPARGQTAAGDIGASFEPLDLADLDSIAAFAERLGAKGRPVDILVNSAGLVATDKRQTRAGFELQFGVNYLGHFALTGRLLPLLRKSGAARVVTLGGAAYRGAEIDFTNLNAERSFNGLTAGGQSMLAKVLFSGELQRRSVAAGWGVSSFGADPGFARTNLLSKSGASPLLGMLSGVAGQLIGHSAAAGAQSAVLAATAEDAVPGGYYAPGGFMGMRGAPVLVEVAPVGSDATIAARLWDASQELTGRPFPRPAADS